MYNSTIGFKKLILSGDAQSYVTYNRENKNTEIINKIPSGGIKLESDNIILNANKKLFIHTSDTNGIGEPGSYLTSYPEGCKWTPYPKDPKIKELEDRIKFLEDKIDKIILKTSEVILDFEKDFIIIYKE